jgi:tol-pal system protein YbgF
MKDRSVMRAFKHLTTVAAVLSVISFTVPAEAQSDLSNRIGRLEQDVQRLQRQGGKGGTPAPVDMPGSDSVSELTQRILALERVVEQLTGQVEEARFTADRNAKQLQVLQDDMGLRLARVEQALGLAGGAPAQQGQLVPAPGSATGSADVAGTSDTQMSTPMSTGPGPRPITPSATASSTAISTGSIPPEGVNDNGGFVIRTDAAGRPLPPDPNAPQAPPPAAPEPTPQQVAPRPAPGPGPVTSGQIASAPAAEVVLPDGTPKQKYEFAFDFLKRQDYPRAESALRQFLKSHPKDPLAGNAQYWLGETYYVRGDFPQAAVEFMAGYERYPKTNKGPDNLLKLGMSMSKLNQTQGACTALSRIGKDYPDAPATVLKQAQAERTKLKCK